MVRLLLVGILLSGSTLCQAQFNEIVNLRYHRTAFHKILQELSERHDVQFSYGNTSIPLHEEVTISIEEKTLKEALSRLFAHLNIDHMIVDTQVVLRGEPVAKNNFPPTAVARSDSSSSANLVTENNSVVPNAFPRNTSPKVLRSYGIDTMFAARSIPLEEREPLFLVISSPYVSYQSSLFPSAIGVVVSLQNYQFHFAPRENPDQQFHTDINYQIGIDAQWHLVHRWSLGIQVLCSRKNFWLDYNRVLFDLNDPVAIPRETHLDLSYLDIPIVIRYDWLRTRRFTLSTYAGVTLGQILSNREHTHFFNGTIETTEFFRAATGSFLWGGTVGLRAAYQISQRWQLHVEPVFLQYGNEVNDQVMQSATQSFGVRLGLSSLLRRH